MFGIKKDNRLIVTGGQSSITIPSANNYGEYIVRGSNNFVIGGTSNVYLGCNSGRISQAAGSVAIGLECGSNNQQGSTVAIGNVSGVNNQQPWSVAIGSEAGQNDLGLRSIAIGQVAGKNQLGIDCIAMGLFAGWQSTGSNAITIGRGTSYNGIGNNSVSIGSVAGDLNINQQVLGSNCIVINSSGLPQTASSGTIVLNADPSSAIISPTVFGGLYIKPVRSSSVTNALYYNTSTNEITYTPSTREQKNNIQPINLDTSGIYNLQPKLYSYKNSDALNIGLIAEDVYEVDNNLCVIDDNNKPVNINWNVVSIYLIEEIKKLKQEIEMLKHK